MISLSHTTLSGHMTKTCRSKLADREYPLTTAAFRGWPVGHEDVYRCRVANICFSLGPAQGNYSCRN